MYEDSVLQEAISIGSVLTDVQQKKQRMIAKRRFLMGLPLSKAQKEMIKHHQHSSHWLPESLVRDNDIFCEKVKMHVVGALDVAAQDPITQETNPSLDVGGALDAVKILERLKDLPTEVLLTMGRKLKGELAATPFLREDRYKNTRDVLIDEVRRKCMELLSANTGDELHAPLARALEIARLSLKLKAGHHNFLEKGFIQVEERTRRLQTEISIAIKLVKPSANEKAKVPFAELSSVLSLLVPNVKVKERRQRTTVKKLLVEYLFECSFMETVPEALVKALTVIHKADETEWEGILSLSATMKQVLLDTLPDHDFDKDYADVNFEELGKIEKKDDIDDVCDYNFDSGSDSDDSEESVGEYVPADSQSPSTIPEEGSSLQHETRNSIGMLNACMDCAGVENAEQEALRIRGDGFSQNPSSSKNSSGNSNMRNDAEVEHLPPSCPVLEEENLMSIEQRSCHNTYLGIQEACDNTSFIASNLIKRILKGMEEGVGEKRKASVGRDLAGPVIVQAVEELAPSLSNSAMQKLKDLMDRQNAG